MAVPPSFRLGHVPLEQLGNPVEAPVVTAPVRAQVPLRVFQPGDPARPHLDFHSVPCVGAHPLLPIKAWGPGEQCSEPTDHVSRPPALPLAFAIAENRHRGTHTAVCIRSMRRRIAVGPNHEQRSSPNEEATADLVLAGTDPDQENLWLTSFHVL
jgi:hypothetical protein